MKPTDVIRRPLITEKTTLARQAGEVIVFEGPAGPMKLERVTRPLVLEKKPVYSSRIGSGVSYEYVFHPTEKTHREVLFRWENNGWTEMDLSAISR